MKAGTSTLNPYAESYIPLSKRGAPDGNTDFKSSGNETRGAKEAMTMGPRHWDPTAQASQSYVSAENSKLKGHAVQGFQSSSSFNPFESEKAILDEEFDMDLAYLQMLFPGISDESLSDVYFANKGDIEATIDMLNHLENCSVDSEKLPDTLDIGDVPESGGGSELASHELKNLNIDAGASSSGGSGSAPVI